MATQVIETQTLTGGQAAIRTADAVRGAIRRDGSLAGRFNASWGEEARWSCLTGMAQTAIVWQRLACLTGDPGHSAGALRVNHFLRTVQDTTSRNPGIRGGIPGSFPVHGEYGKYRFLNWAAKFFMDALMLEALSGKVINLG